MDAYEGFAERYDWWHTGKGDPVREEFYRKLFAEHGVTRVLDCACGTGRDLIRFHSMGLEVSGSDLSDAMLAQTHMNLRREQIEIPIQNVDYRDLPSHWDVPFDAVVCLANSINELLEDVETLRALRSMKSVLRLGGILVFSQGQSDATMRDPPAFAPILNNRDFTRFYTMEYLGDVMAINIFDFVHTAETSDFKHWSVRLRIRLQDSWSEMLEKAGFSDVGFYGNWDRTPYDKDSSQRLICVAKN